ncbi:response regulator transcription factor [Candidatus Uhrbacteria bacterium]|nr:response regulator transcription factor [Candidatus Uhrbacteria bacterium]
MAKKSLLMIDQDAFYGGIYANRFESAGWSVALEETIGDADKRLEREVPDVIIMDLNPLDESLAFLQRVRQNPKTTQVLQIALTDLGDRETMLLAMDAGVDSYLLKGHFVPAEAVKKVKRLLEEKKSV